MLEQIKLKNVKSFTDAELPLSSFTVLFGTNASGKSNVRDILRFLHGLSRGYKLVELFAGKYEGSDRVWAGVRGGPYGFMHYGTKTCELNVSFANSTEEYQVALHETHGKQIVVQAERLHTAELPVFNANKSDNAEQVNGSKLVHMLLPDGNGGFQSQYPTNDQAVITQIDAYLSGRTDDAANHCRETIKWVLNNFSAMRFLDLSPNLMREPTYPGPLMLGDAGENLSTVLFNLIENENRGDDIVSWLRELTPLDVAALDFEKDNRGRLSLVLVEHDKRRTPVESASDGTLRFLAYLALAFSTASPTTCFVEEIDNGIHPSRLRLLVELLETQTGNGKLQVVASSHSPALMNLLGPETLNNALLLYRTEESSSSKAMQLKDIPDFDKIVTRRQPGQLLESGWFENTVEAIDYRG